MLRIRIIKAVGPRVRYFLTSPALTDQERQGVWLGAGASEAGYADEVTARDFRAGLEGYGPHGNYLGQRRKIDRRAGWDIVLTPNKSISVAALCAPPEVAKLVRESWDAAVRDFTPILESLACRHNGGVGNMPTGNLAIAAFTHERSRRNDPLIHTHFIVLNATFDRANGQIWRGLEPAPLFRHSALLDAAFQRELHRHMVARGLPASLDKKGRASLPVPEELCLRLSSAKTAIDEAMAKLPLFPTTTRIWHIQTKRARLNDQLRPPKTLPPVPIFNSITPIERVTIMRLCQPPANRVRPPAPSAKPADVAPLISRIYRQRTLWDAPKKLFSSMLSAAQTLLHEPLSVFLCALPLVPAPRGDRGSTTTPLTLDQINRLRPRTPGATLKRPVAVPRRRVEVVSSTIPVPVVVPRPIVPMPTENRSARRQL